MLNRFSFHSESQRPVTDLASDLASFEATINPEGAVTNNIVVCRFNNETRGGGVM